jgi:hypothetical protein
VEKHTQELSPHVSPDLTVSDSVFFTTECIFEFRMNLITNSYFFFPKQSYIAIFVIEKECVDFDIGTKFLNKVYNYDLATNG